MMNNSHFNHVGDCSSPALSPAYPRAWGGVCASYKGRITHPPTPRLRQGWVVGREISHGAPEHSHVPAVNESRKIQSCLGFVTL